MFKQCLENVRACVPLIHNITNYVTVNDVANMLLACGGSPIMAQELDDVEDIQTISDGLYLNIGTLGTNFAMTLAGKKANELDHPIVFDPVGAGASRGRNDAVEMITSELDLSCIKGNISEIKYIVTGTSSARGVDASSADALAEGDIAGAAGLAKRLSAETGAVIVITGATDIVADPDRAYLITNGHPIMSSITGAGCMLGAVIAAYISANRDNRLEAAAAAVSAEGLCGEIAFDIMERERSGNASFRNHLIDAMYRLTGDELEKGAGYEII